MLSSDSSGFLTGAPATDLMKRLLDGQDAGLDLLRSIRMDTKGMLKQARARNRLASAVAVPSVRSKSVAAGERAAVAPRKPAAMPQRNTQGRFIPRTAKPLRKQGSASGTSPAPPAAGGAPGSEREPGEGYGSRIGSFFTSRRQAAKDLAVQVASVDAGAGIVKEAAGLAKPTVDLVRGSPEDRREKRTEKKAEARQKSSEKWYKRIYEGVTGKGALTKARASGGVIGWIASLLIPMIAAIAASFGKLPGTAIGRGLGGLLGGAGRLFGGIGRSRIGRVGGSLFRGLARSKTPLIGTALSILGYGADYAFGQMGSGSAEQKRAARYHDIGKGTGGISGAILSSAIGFAIAGPIGAWIGGAGGALIGESIGAKFGDWTKYLIDADIPGIISHGWHDFTGWLEDHWHSAKNTAAGAGKAAKSVAMGIMDKIGMLESGGDYSARAQVRKFLMGQGGSTASGKYQFLDSTFASIVARHGSGDHALFGLVPIATAYNADKRSARNKLLDPQYSLLRAAKQNPASADAAMRYLLGDEYAVLAGRGISAPTDEQLYALHLSGNPALSQALKGNPGVALSNYLTPDQIAKNPGLFSGITTVGQLQDKLHRRFASVATPNIPGVKLPSLVGIGKIPAAPDISTPALVGLRDSILKVVTVPVPQIGQNVADRGIAHVATGGIGMRADW